MLAPAIPSQGPGAGDLAKECALLGVYIPGSAWEAKGSGCQWEPGTRQGGGTGQTSLPPPSQTHCSCPTLPGPPWASLNAEWQLWRQSQEEDDTQPPTENSI